MNTPHWPLRVAPTNRHLEDSSGVPFRLNVDAAWFAPTEFWLADPASAADFELYLTDRAARGFTALLVMGMVSPGYDEQLKFNGGDFAHLPANRLSGAAPLATPQDFSTPLEPYWANVAAIIAAARRHGIAVLLAYQYLGYQGGKEGWWAAVNAPANTQAVLADFATWLATLLRGNDNVIWYPYGDFNPPPGEGSRRVRATIEAIAAAWPGALFAAELDNPDDVIGDNADADELLHMNSFYGYGPSTGGAVYVTADQAWRATPTRPSWVCEPQYEAAKVGGSGTADDVRQAEWYAVLGGGTAGQVYGALGVFNFVHGNDGPASDWHDAIDLPAAAHMAVQFALWAELPWWDFAPSGTDPGFCGYDIVVDGQDDVSAQRLRHIASAATTDGRVVVAYVPGRDAVRTFTVDTSRVVGAPATWIDPTSGRRVPIGAVSAATLVASTPGANDAGAQDWVLLIDGRGR